MKLEDQNRMLTVRCDKLKKWQRGHSASGLPEDEAAIHEMAASKEALEKEVASLKEELEAQKVLAKNKEDCKIERSLYVKVHKIFIVTTLVMCLLCFTICLNNSRNLMLFLNRIHEYKFKFFQ